MIISFVSEVGGGEQISENYTIPGLRGNGMELRVRGWGGGSLGGGYVNYMFEGFDGEGKPTVYKKSGRLWKHALFKSYS